MGWRAGEQRKALKSMAISASGVADGPREPGGAESLMVTAGVKGERGRGVRTMGRGGTTGSEAGGGSLGLEVAGS